MTIDAASSVSFFRSGDKTIIHDPGFVPDRKVILDPLRDRGVAPTDVTDVVISHHHPDHTLNIALFENAQTHDVWGIYKNDKWHVRMAEGVDVAPGVRLIQTPGHTDQDITMLVNTKDGLVAFTHLWWRPDTPTNDDPVGTNNEAFHLSRERVLGLQPALIVPGHGPAFEPTSKTPR
ncbi:MBL fold metallo-hydrolase [Nocardioides sp. NPDC006303]|uniref:MBL fold metallo-hydrolase n=1 Tax=Nocardioides sp. NPDC006303 TaxID=3156747 RepID=UPI0033B2B04E